MRKLFSILLIVIGLICCAISIYPIFEMNQQVNESLNEWEEIKNQEPSEEKAPLEEGLIGILKISSYEDLIPIRLGTTDSILKKGIGVDETTVLPGEVGNSVLYGHREKILWNLKDVKLGDEIKIETLDAELTFIINDIQVLDPDDEYIYETSEEATITLVTCYPFIYMGPTPERYVVKAVLQK
ncbi:MAG: class D sortase [Turicibacter sp.]|nr:class D sortase [Turicibacter sp.]